MYSFHEWMSRVHFVCPVLVVVMSPPARLWRIKHQFESGTPNACRGESCKLHERNKSFKKWDVVRLLAICALRQVMSLAIYIQPSQLDNISNYSVVD